MRAILSLALLVALATLGSAATASEIPQSQLDEDYKACLPSCESYGADKCQAFCQCTNDQAKTNFTWEEYQALANAINTGDVADQNSFDKMKKIGSYCGTQHLQGP